MMRKTFALLLLAVALSANTLGQSNPGNINPSPPDQPSPSSRPERAPATPERELPSLPEGLLNREIESLDKGSFRLADFNGKVIVINLWASLCGPCRMEIPDYEKVRKEFAGKAVEFIGLTTEDPRTSTDYARQFAHDLNFTFRLGWADYVTARTLLNGFNTLPQTFVLLPDGHIISYWRGYSRTQSRDLLRNAINRALSEGSSTSQKF
jgi:thiol-disulfide isomerase/thioredoxin